MFSRRTISVRHGPLRVLVVALGAVLLAQGAAVAAEPEPAASPRPDPVLEWFDQTDRSMVFPTQITNIRTWVIGWTAASRAIGSHGDGVFAQAALASAVHDSLVSIVPARQAELDAALATSLAPLPDVPAKTEGVQAGHNAAAQVLAERAGDGLDPASVNAPFTPPPPAPGAWQPTPPAFNPAQQAGQAQGRTFVLDRADRFRAAPPPALTSALYTRDFTEIKEYGRVDSTVRTPLQTNIALLWRPTNLLNWNQILRQVLADDSTRSLRDRVQLVATFHAVTGDAYITVFDTKYTYLAWRPITAIRLADTDGNPDTQPDPAWNALFPTPDHPEYASGHTAYAGAAVTVLTALVGPKPVHPVTLTATTAPGFERTYTSWAQAGQDVIDARVWAGLHFRNTDEVGFRQGTQVAGYDLARLTG